MVRLDSIHEDLDDLCCALELQRAALNLLSTASQVCTGERGVVAWHVHASEVSEYGHLFPFKIMNITSSSYGIQR